MNTNELIERATERLNKTDNPLLPPEDTLSAIIQLGKERDEAKEKAVKLAGKVGELTARASFAEVKMSEANLESKKAKDFAKEQAWIAQELGKFVCDIANGIYAGQEIAAAKRVYDLNGGSIKKKRLNAYNFDSYEEAKDAYREHCKEDGIAFDEINMLPWLFNFAERP